MRRSARGNRRLPRRNVLAGGASIIVGMTSRAVVANEGDDTPVTKGTFQAAGTPLPETGRLQARPSQPTASVSPGLHRLGLDPDRDAVLYVPQDYRPEQPAPFVLSLHGAGGDATGGLYPLGDLANEYGLILLAPASRKQTWDMVMGGFGPDITFIDLALTTAFARCAVDAARVAAAGFSDGASYALSIGVTNGDLFPAILAFSPGFIAPTELHGKPRIFISHGTRDQVLPIAGTSRRIVRLFAGAGYDDVVYSEFDGGHTVPPDVARAAVDWFLSPPATEGSTATPSSGSEQASPAADPANAGVDTEFSLYTFGDSILDCGWYNEWGIHPGQLLVRNDDRLFPEFQGQDLSSHGPARLVHRAVDGATVEDLPAQARGLAPGGASAAIVTVGGNDLLRGLLADDGPGIEAFEVALDAFLTDLPVRPVLLGNVYDPTFGDDTANFTGVEPALARRNHDRLNAVIADIAARHGQLVDLHTHFLGGGPSWYAQTIEPSLRGASEVRRCFLPGVLAAQTEAG